ncbi:MAG: isopropylmalate isomerase [Candidatus Sumerlaeota bacterium]|nr:isopropylmalate isomerase [Candidatus Sumerlaeota bacterium]
MKRTHIKGRAVSLRGNDIDTDRIIPARYLRCVVFDGLGGHAFKDDREQLRAKGRTHPFDHPDFAQAEILLVNKNFGCGSSREHAPQSIARWGKGIKAIAGESFAEIFFGNCVALGIPCVTVSEAGIDELMTANEADPAREFALDLETMTLTCQPSADAAERAKPLAIKVSLPAGPRQQFIRGRWDSAAELLDAKNEVAAAAAKLPYFSNWR